MGSEYAHKYMTIKSTLRKENPHSELFWSAFSSIQTEYSTFLCIQSKCRKRRTRITPNTDIFHSVVLMKLDINEDDINN